MTPLLPVLAPLTAAAEFLLHWLGNGLVQGSLLAILTWGLIRWPLRAHPSLHGALWLIVLIKFIAPIGPAFEYSLATAWRSLSGAIQAGETPAAAAGFGASDAVIVATLSPIEMAARNPLSPAAAAPHGLVRVAPLLAGAYLAIVLALFGRRIALHRALVVECRRLPGADDRVRAEVARVCRGVGLRNIPDTRISDRPPAPFVLGAIRPILVLSPRQLADAGELEAVILHETAHIRRADALVRCLQCLAGTVLFFWPVVAWVNRRIDLARNRL